MTKKEFLELFKNQLQNSKEEVNEMTNFRNLEDWDSMASLLIIAMFDDDLNINLSAEDLSSCSTVGDLMKLAGL